MLNSEPKKVQRGDSLNSMLPHKAIHLPRVSPSPLLLKEDHYHLSRALRVTFCLYIIHLVLYHG
jgi:hypothetical protein